MDANESERWQRQLEWGEGMQWIGIGYARTQAAVIQFEHGLHNHCNETGKRLRQVSGEDAGKTLHDVEMLPANGCDLVVINAAKLADAEQREVIVGINRGRDRVRRMTRDGVLVVLTPRHRASVRELAPDLRSMCAIVIDVDELVRQGAGPASE